MPNELRSIRIYFYPASKRDSGRRMDDGDFDDFPFLYLVFHYRLLIDKERRGTKRKRVYVQEHNTRNTDISENDLEPRRSHSTNGSSNSSGILNHSASLSQTLTHYIKVRKNVNVSCMLKGQCTSRVSRSYLILFYPIFLTKSYFVLFFGKCPVLSYFFGHFAFNFGIL